MDCGSTIQVLSTGQDGEAKLLVSSESGSDSGCGQLVGNEDPVAIPTGERRGDRFEVLVRPKDNLGSRLAIVNVKKIVSSALALERLRQAERERESLWPKDEPPDQEVGVFTSAEMTNLLATARRVAPTEIPILLTGETGTGKEVLGRAIHGASNRATKPFLAFNCAAVPRDMLESQLFGYRRGAFTGAQDAFPGVIRGAAGGTVFLDEVGEIPPETQPKLLRFLETKEIHPLGETEPISVDVRVVAATNADLDRLVGERRFREDLLYRLNVVRFHVPPLRQRREEIPQLVNHFLLRYADELQRGRPQISEEAMEYLLLYGWPGNVRQLANEIHRAVVLVEPNGCITPDTLSVDVRASRRTMPTGVRPSADEMLVRTDQPLAKAIERVERVMVARALERASGRFETAAKLLGVTRKGLFLKRQRLGLKSPPA
jgi:transcriptional regulator with PAS, ATPase and Fis domain